MEISTLSKAFISSLILIIAISSRAIGEGSPKIKVLQTASGVRFGLLGEKGQLPAPTLFIFSTSMQDSLEADIYNKVGRLLAGHSFLSASLDLPCHGEDQRTGEPSGLDGWRARLEKDDQLVPAFISKVSAVLDFLIKNGYTDPDRVAACGTSRGGFIAMHFAATDARVKCVAAFSPVTKLQALREFKTMDTGSLDLSNSAAKLASRAVWICIGNNDERVGTNNAIALAQRIIEAAIAQRNPVKVLLLVVPAEGHRVHSTAHDEAATWILQQLDIRE